MARDQLSRKNHEKSLLKNHSNSIVLKDKNVNVGASKGGKQNSSRRPCDDRAATEEVASKSKRPRNKTNDSTASFDISNISMNGFESTADSVQADISCTSNDSYDNKKLLRKKSTVKAGKSSNPRLLRRAATVAPISNNKIRTKTSSKTSIGSPTKLPFARMNTTVQVASSHEAISAVETLRRNTTSEWNISSCGIYNAFGEQIPSSKWNTLRGGRGGHRIEFVPSLEMRKRGVTVTQEVLSEQLNKSENESTLDFLPKCRIKLNESVKRLVYIQGREPEIIDKNSGRDFLESLADWGSIFAAEV